MQHKESEWLQTLTGARIRICTSGAETDNRLTIIDFIEPPRSAPPVFTQHEFIEVFSIIRGTLCFQFLDEPCVRLREGECVTCGSYRPHSFWNETDDSVHIQLTCSPAGLDQFFVESDRLSKSDYSQSDADVARKALRNKYGLEHVGVPPERPG